MTAAALNSLVSSLNAGLRAGGTFKPEAWNRAYNAVREVAGQYRVWITKDKVQQKVENMKGLYRLWKELLDNSQWSIDEQGRPSAPLAVMEAYFEAHPAAKRFREKSLAHRDDLAVLFDHDVPVANGENARTIEQLMESISRPLPGRTTPPLDLTTDDDDDDDEEEEVVTSSLPLRKRAADVRASTPSASKKRMTALNRVADSLDRLTDQISRSVDAFEARVPIERAVETLYTQFGHLPGHVLAAATRVLADGNGNTARAFLAVPEAHRHFFLKEYLPSIDEFDEL